MKTIHNLTEKHINDLHTLYQDEWWTKGRSLNDTKDCINGSQVTVGITSDADTLVAFARVLTDFTYKALIFDLIVRADHRGFGVR